MMGPYPGEQNFFVEGYLCAPEPRPRKAVPLGFGTQAFTKDPPFSPAHPTGETHQVVTVVSRLVTMILQISDKSPPLAGVYLSLLQERFCYRILTVSGMLHSSDRRKRMSVARIICTNLEDALQLAVPLSERFDEVQITEPGCPCGEADLEINLECCSLDEAMASVSLLIAADATENTARQRPTGKMTETAAWAWLASDQACHSQAGPIGDRLVDRSSAPAAERSGNGMAAPADRLQPSGMQLTGNTPASFIKKPRRGHGLVGWLCLWVPTALSRPQQ